jgi:hypothetical protein
MLLQMLLMSGYHLRGSLLQMLHNSPFIVCIHHFLNHMQSIQRTISETGAQTVAEIISDNTRFTVYNSQCAFRTGGDT